MCQTLLSLLNTLSRVSRHGNTPEGGARQRVSQALQDLHSIEKTVENNEQLLVSVAVVRLKPLKIPFLLYKKILWNIH